jgi:hypothetical protein
MIAKREAPYSKHKAINGIEGGSKKSNLHMLNTPHIKEHVLSASCSSHGKRSQMLQSGIITSFFIHSDMLHCFQIKIMVSWDVTPVWLVHRYQ